MVRKGSRVQISKAAPHSMILLHPSGGVFFIGTPTKNATVYIVAFMCKVIVLALLFNQEEINRYLRRHR